MKTKTFSIILAIAFTAMFSFPKPVSGQAIDTTYMIEISEAGDSTCFMLFDTVKAEVDCATAIANIGPPVEDPPVADEKFNIIDFLKRSWAWILANIALLIGIAELIVRLTPSEKDNNILRIIQSWLDRLIPNRRAGGGRFVAFDNKDDAPKLAVVGNEKLPEDEK